MTQDVQQKIDAFVSEVCSLLDIAEPMIRPATENEITDSRATDTTIAAASLDGKEVILFQVKETPDLYFAVAHELRHVWQMRNKPDMFDWYLPSSQLDRDTYNLQPAELDANAFAMIVMNDVFHVRPLFHGLKRETVERIYEEAEELANALMDMDERNKWK